jgi:hypothetical protein
VPTSDGEREKVCGVPMAAEKETRSPIFFSPIILLLGNRQVISIAVIAADDISK